MFIVSKKTFIFRLPDGGTYRVERDYMGEVPDFLAENKLFQWAVKGGDIMTPATTSDRDIHKADADAVKAAQKVDKRPDAVKAGEIPAEAEKPVKKASKRSKK